MHDWPPRGGAEERIEKHLLSYPILWQLVKRGWIGTGTASTQPSVHMTTKYAMTQHDPPLTCIWSTKQPRLLHVLCSPPLFLLKRVCWMDGAARNVNLFPLYLIISSLDEKMKKGHSFASQQKSPSNLIHFHVCLCQVEVYCVVLATILTFIS